MLSSLGVSDSDGDSDVSDNGSDDEDSTVQELERKRQHPDRLHKELWYNDPGEVLCKSMYSLSL